MSHNDRIKCKNYYQSYDDYCIIKIYSKKYGYRNVYIDIEDIPVVSKFKWSLSKGRNTFYCQSKYKKDGKWINIKLHRLITNYKEYVDHINGNGLDNRKSNLREVDNSINQKNRKSNNKIFPNVIFREDKYDNGRFVAKWKEETKSKSKSYSIAKYGYKEALNKAINKSIRERKKNEYIVNDIIIKIKRV